jgi:diguanylate cyclase (GGDEF)-like protein
MSQSAARSAWLALDADSAEREGSGEAGAQCPACGYPRAGPTTDWLTGLLDRRAWDRLAPPALATASERGRSSVVLVVDIDRFKRINDELGHLAGDAVLCAAAAQVRQSLGERDIAARLGGHAGDEFLVLLPGAQPRTGLAVARAAGAGIRAIRRVRTADSRWVDVGTGVGPGVSASIGLAVDRPDRPAGLADLVHEADQALRSAKQWGRDRICVPAPTLVSSCRYCVVT